MARINITAHPCARHVMHIGNSGSIASAKNRKQRIVAASMKMAWHQIRQHHHGGGGISVGINGRNDSITW